MISGKAVDGFFLAEHFPAENIICKNADGGEEKPQHREKQAYLTEKVERQLFVVPYLPIEPEVDYTAAEKFKGGDYKRSYSHLDGEREVEFFVNAADQQKADPS